MVSAQSISIKHVERVAIVLAHDQYTGLQTAGTDRDIHTNFSSRPHGIMARLTSDKTSRVKVIH